MIHSQGAKRPRAGDRSSSRSNQEPDALDPYGSNASPAALNRALSTSLPSRNPMVAPMLMTDPEAPPEPGLHTVAEVAARLKVSTKTVRRRIKDGTIRTVPIGGRLLRISSDELRRLISGPSLEP
jgi:excisionase family DNA binding protein